jgi:transposase
MKAQTVHFDQLIKRGCGIDVHKSLIVATVKGEGLQEETRSCDGFTESLEQLRDWLKENGVTHVAMESTGVYWKPVFNILEEDFEVILVNARHIKNVPGHKTDKKDSKWIAKLLLCGLLKGSFIPPKHIREMRDLTRYKRKVIEQTASEKNRIQKILEDANIKLSSVVSDMSGAVATRIVNALIGGEDSVDELVKFHHGKMRCTKEELAASLRGKLTTHHRFMLQAIKESMGDKERLIAKLDDQIEKMLRENELELDAKLLETIPGVGKDGAAYILAEIGNDMGRFPQRATSGLLGGGEPRLQRIGWQKKK